MAINTIVKAYSSSNIRCLNFECFGIDIDIDLDLILSDSVGCSNRSTKYITQNLVLLRLL